jgi:hypothetical protein
VCWPRKQAHEWLHQQGIAAKSNVTAFVEGQKVQQVISAVQQTAYAWLVQRAEIAQEHDERRYRSIVWLRRRATLAKVALAEQARALCELLTIASHAMLQQYSQLARKGKVEKEKVRGEMVRCLNRIRKWLLLATDWLHVLVHLGQQRIKVSDQRRRKELRKQPIEVQWKAELQEAFTQICRGYSHPHQPPTEESLNMLQFRRMICGGRYKLLNISIELIPDCFRFVDADKSGAVSFAELFTWFR